MTAHLGPAISHGQVTESPLSHNRKQSRSHTFGQPKSDPQRLPARVRSWRERPRALYPYAVLTFYHGRKNTFPEKEDGVFTRRHLACRVHLLAEPLAAPTPDPGKTRVKEKAEGEARRALCPPSRGASHTGFGMLPSRIPRLARCASCSHPTPGGQWGGEDSDCEVGENLPLVGCSFPPDSP